MYFVTFTTGNYTDMTKNLLINFEKILVPCGHRIILICMDETATRNLNMYDGLEWVVFQSRQLNTQMDISTFDTPSFNILNSFKPTLLKELLETYNELYWIDSDIVFYQDPEPYIRSMNKELIFQQDNEEDTYRLCTGNFYMKQTEATFRFFTLWIENLKQNPAMNEQILLNTVVYQQFGSFFNIPWLDGGVFPPEKFQRGHDAFKLKWWRRDDKECIHVNYIEGFENKKEALKILQEWRVEDS